MTELNSGETSSQQHVDKLNEILTQYETSLGVKINKTDSKVEHYMNLKPAELNKLDRDQCGEAAILLAQYSLYLQRQQNREKAVINWSDSKIKLQISGETQNYHGSSFDERRMMAIKGNSYTANLFKLKMLSQARLDTIEFLSGRVSFLSRIYSTLSGARHG